VIDLWEAARSLDNAVGWVTSAIGRRRNGRAEYRDTLYEEYQTVVELDGRVAHPGDSRWNDIHRDNAAVTAGLSTLRYGWRDVTMTPCAIAAEIADALARRGYDSARPCSPACPVGRKPTRADCSAGLAQLADAQHVRPETRRASAGVGNVYARCAPRVRRATHDGSGTRSVQPVVPGHR
jgi:hypothetical protein